MATTTPNYGWDVPTSSDYVKDGATAIETLGDDIDATLYSITNGKNVGLVPIATTSFTAQTNVDILNCFSSTYDNYKIEVLVYNTGANVDNNFRWQLLSGSTPATSTYAEATYFVNTSGTAAIWSAASSLTSALVTQYGTNGAISTCDMTLHNPSKATWTTCEISTFAKYGTAAMAAIFGSNGHYTTTAYDGIRFISSGANNATGIIRVYGLRNS